MIFWWLWVGSGADSDFTGLMAGYINWSLLRVYAYCRLCWGSDWGLCRRSWVATTSAWAWAWLSVDCNGWFQGAELWQRTWLPLAVTGGRGRALVLLAASLGQWRAIGLITATGLLHTATRFCGSGWLREGCQQIAGTKYHSITPICDTIVPSASLGVNIMGIRDDPTCSSCEEGPETATHFIWECSRCAALRH